MFPVPALLGKHAASPSYKGPILLHHAGIWIQRETCMIIFGIWWWGSAGGVCVPEVGVRARHTSPCSDSFLRFPGFCLRQAQAATACDGAAALLRLLRRRTAPSNPVRPPVRRCDACSQVVLRHQAWLRWNVGWLVETRGEAGRLNTVGLTDGFPSSSQLICQL